MQPLMDRKNFCKRRSKEWPDCGFPGTLGEPAPPIHTSKAKQRGLEGVVGKRKDGVYIQGKRTKDWKKSRTFWMMIFVVCGYIRKGQPHDQYRLGTVRQKEGVFAVQKPCHPGRRRQAIPERGFWSSPGQFIPPFEAPPGHGNEDAVWLAPSSLHGGFMGTHQKRRYAPAGV